MLLESSADEPVHKDIYQRDAAPAHPGEVLREDILTRLDLSRAAVARRLGISHQKLTAVLNEKAPVTADLAMRLGALLGHGARYWLGLQMQYDLWLIDQPPTFKVQALVVVKRPARRTPPHLRA